MSDRNRIKTPENKPAVPDVSVIIAVYNHADFLEKVITGLSNQTFKKFEVLIADDGSGPEIAQLISRMQQSAPFPLWHVRHDHAGFRKTIIVNTAVAQSKGDYLVFLDGDCIPHHAFLASHVRYKSLGVALSGRRVMLDAVRTESLSTHDVSSRRLEHRRFWWDHCPAEDRKHGIYLRGASRLENPFRKKNYSILGCNFSIYKSDFRLVNGYDEEIIGRGMEDNNLEARLRLEKIRIRSVTREAIVYHLHHSFAPVPFDQQTRNALNTPSRARVKFGLNRHSTDTTGLSLPAASVIIAVYNQPAFLEMVLISLQRQTLNDFQIIVADDGSGPAVRETIETYSGTFRHPILHAWHEDDGFRKTIIVNKAVLCSQAPYLIFIDGDCICHHRFVERHLKRSAPGTVLSGRRVHFDQTLTVRVTHNDIRTRTIERISFWRRHCKPEDFKHGIFIPFSTPLENAFRTCWPILGSNFSLFKKDFLEVNGYDERIIGRGMEDSNLYERFKVKGTKTCTIVREALQYHLFHSFDPIPHDARAMQSFCHPTEWFTPFGLTKTNQHSSP